MGHWARAPSVYAVHCQYICTIRVYNTAPHLNDSGRLSHTHTHTHTHTHEREREREIERERDFNVLQNSPWCLWSLL